MDQTKKSNKIGLYVLIGLVVLVILGAIFVFGGSNQEEAAPAADDQIAGGGDNQDDEQSSCSAYTQAVGELNAKYQTELNTFYQTAHDQARHPAPDDSQALTLSRTDGLKNYDTELNALRAKYDIIGYDFYRNDLLGDRQNVDPSDYCLQEAAGSFATDLNRLRDIFDLDQHSSEIRDLNNQHQLAQFVADYNVPNSTDSWAPPNTDGNNDQPLADWTTAQKEAFITAAADYRLAEYIAKIDRLKNDYNLGVFEALMTDLEVRYNLSPSWLVGGGEQITSSQIYNQDSNINYYTITNIRQLLEPAANSSQ